MYEMHTADPAGEVNSQSACQISHLLPNKMCIVMFTQAPQPVNILSHMNPDHTSKSTSPRYISNYLSIDTQISHVVCFWHSSLPTKNVCGLQPSPTQAAHNPFHPLWFYHHNNFSRRVQTMAFLIKKYSQSPAMPCDWKCDFLFTKLCAQQNTIVLKMIHTQNTVWNNKPSWEGTCKWTCNVCFVSPLLFLMYCKIICDNRMFWHQGFCP
jgi:hypothetical protein